MNVDWEKRILGSGVFFPSLYSVAPHASAQIRLKIAVRFEIEGRGEFRYREIRGLATRRNEVKRRF